MRLIFAGSGEFALPALAVLADSPHEIVLVITQPDRPAGRGRRLAPTPVRSWAEVHGLETIAPVTLKSADVEERLRVPGPEVLVVASYGCIVPPAILGLPRYGAVNIHPSLLPRWRGATPVERAIEAGDPETGVAIMQMDAGLDTGPVLKMERLAIRPGETAGELSRRLAELGCGLLLEVLDALSRGTVHAVPQQGAASYAGRLTSAEARLDFREPAIRLARRVLAFNPRPGAWAECAGERVRLLRAEALATATGPAAPGTIVASGDGGLDVAAGAGILRITELQRPGGRPLTVAAFARGHDWVGRRFQ